MSSDCCTRVSHASKIKVQENGKQAVFLNASKEKFVTTKVDGCLIVGATACDWWVMRLQEDSVLVELKGSDVDHALKQIEETFAHLKESGRLTSRMAALIVCRKPSRHPSFTAKVQKVKSRLSKAYKAPLHIVTANHEFQMERVLSQTGPF